MRTLAAVGLSIGVLGGVLALPASAADTATVRASSGVTYEGTIDAPGDTHVFVVEDIAPQLFSVSLKAAKGSSLLPDLFLEDPVAVDQTAALAPFRRDGARSVVVRNADTLSVAGRWLFRVGGKTGSAGGYKLKITAKVVRVFKGSGTVPGAPDVAFFAPTASTVLLKVTPATGSVLVPVYGALVSPPCAAAEAVPGVKPGTATVAVPFSGDYSVGIVGNGGTEGGFRWIAKVKPLKPSKVPVRVNGGALYFPGEGPAPAKFVARPGQDLFGFDTDGIDLCWREVRTSGNPMQQGKNSISCTTVTGKKGRNLANNFASDPSPPPRAFALGPSAAATVAGGALYLVPRDAGGETTLDGTLGTAVRVLVSRDSVFLLETSGIQRYDFMGTPSPVSSDGSVYHDMVFGGLGLVFAVETAGGDLEVRTTPFAGGGDTLLADLGPNPGLQGLAAFGPTVFVAVADGAGGAILHRASACDPGNPEVLQPFPMAPILALAADSENAYAVESDPADGPRVVQVPAGGGVRTVIARGNDVTGFDVLGSGLVAAKGYVYFVGNDGNDSFYRVRRR
jgi:hypothetical protein